MTEDAPYHGAGILLWQDKQNYVRLEIASDLDHPKHRPYANFELRREGRITASLGLPIKDGSTWIRLERRGNELNAAFSPDGVRWTSFTPLTIEFDDRLSFGIAAMNSATTPLKVEFQQFSITEKDRPTDEGREKYDKLARP